jgi:hypothetical protein
VGRGEGFRSETVGLTIFSSNLLLGLLPGSAMTAIEQSYTGKASKVGKGSITGKGSSNVGKGSTGKSRVEAIVSAVLIVKTLAMTREPERYITSSKAMKGGYLSKVVEG